MVPNPSTSSVNALGSSLNLSGYFSELIASPFIFVKFPEIRQLGGEEGFLQNTLRERKKCVACVSFSEISTTSPGFKLRKGLVRNQTSVLITNIFL